MRLTADIGYPAHTFCGEVIDPFFSGDRGFQLEQAADTKVAADKYGVTICDFYTGASTHRFHGLSHCDPRAREQMAVWFDPAAEIAVAMGTDALGGHWDALSVEVLSDPERTVQATKRLYQTFKDLSVRLQGTGLRAIYEEQRYIPSEKPRTLDETEEFLV